MLRDRFPPSEEPKPGGAVDLLTQANRQLSDENQRLKAAARQRAADVAIQFSEGLAVLLAEANAGNKGAAFVLDSLTASIQELSARRAGLIVAKG